MAATAPMQQDRVPPKPTEPRPLSILKGLRDPLGSLHGFETKYGDIVELRRGRSYGVFNPDFIRHVLQENAQNYQKGARYRAALARLMGNGLLTSEGSFWLRQRRIAQPAFHRRHFETLTRPVVPSTVDMLHDWEHKARQQQPVALREALTDLTLHITLRNLFSADADAHLPTLMPAIQAVYEEMHVTRIILPVQLPAWIKTPGRIRFTRALATIDEFVYRTIRERRAHPGESDDLVSVLLAARDEVTGESMNDTQLRDELVTMMNAAHDTVTDALTWTFVLLAKHPEHRTRAREEVRQVLNGALPTVATVQNMPFLGRVFHEVLRLYPPVWAFARTAIADDRLDGYRIPAGAFVIMSPYAMHRSARYWSDPLVFDPDRFLPERSEGRPKFAFFPFGGGQRLCIGAGLAMLEGPIILASILERFDFDLLDRGEIAASPRVSLRPRDTVWISLRQLP